MKIIVIGAGLAGITIANSLSDLNFDVVLIESGNKQSVPDKSHKYLFKKFNSNITNGIGLGGTTKFWHSGMTSIKYKAYSSKTPFEVSNLFKSLEKRYYAKAIKLISPNNSKAIFSALTFYKNKNTHIYYPNTNYSPIPSQRITLFLNANIKKIKTHGGSFVGIEISSPKGRAYISGDFLIISGGGLGSPKLVREFFPLSNKSHTGKMLIDHPMNFVGKILITKKSKLKISGIKKLSDGIVRTGYVISNNHSSARHLIFLRPCFDFKLRKNIIRKKLEVYSLYKKKSFFKLLIKLFDLDIISEMLYTKFNFDFKTKYYSVFAMIDQSPSKLNLINYTNQSKAISWNLSKSDFVDFKKALNNFIRLNRLLYIEDPNAFSDFVSAAHYSNTCSIGNSIKSAVVDSDLKLFGYSNVFVCDGSVVPRNSAVNTGLTILAMSLRLCDFISKGPN